MVVVVAETKIDLELPSKEDDSNVATQSSDKKVQFIDFYQVKVKGSR